MNKFSPVTHHVPSSVLWAAQSQVWEDPFLLLVLHQENYIWLKKCKSSALSSEAEVFERGVGIAGRGRTSWQ
jgi:hypothetical protein